MIVGRLLGETLQKGNPDRLLTKCGRCGHLRLHHEADGCQQRDFLPPRHGRYDEEGVWQPRCTCPKFEEAKA